MAWDQLNDILQALSSLTLIAGLPFAIFVHIIDRRKTRQNEQDNIYVMLGDSYFDFVRMTLSAADLNIWDKHDNAGLTQKELGQKWALFEALISIFERAYLFSYVAGREPDRRWRPWLSFMREWCQREDFSEWLPELVEDEDPEFAAYILDLLATSRANPPRIRPPQAMAQ